ncbi:DUF3822 family protein [Tenacibaculum sp. MAR_2009_124]|uniref:DUF3822 family protein n=1 Tax=Tenacibaculum sp. MAR_2009_124 TaxID=1250059 RepID=UPI002101935F|nr:DUF3822 family protein [Tenacibaculum sp. MAR_2009_124]
MQKKSKKISAIAPHKSLSIQFSLDGFSFCIRNSESKEILNYTEYSFDKTVASPELLLEKIMFIFGNDSELQQEFTSVFAIHQNNLATIVPNEYFDRNNLKPYLNFSVKTLSTDFLTYDNLESIEAHNVYIPYVNINNFIFQNFGEFEYKHHSSLLINKLLSYSTSKESEMFVYAGVSQMDILVMKDEQLILYNSFLYETKEDFIYYILFVAEQLHLDPEEFNLTLLGKIEENSDLYQITYKFVRNINFIESSTVYFNSNDELSNHSTYLLLL